MEKPTTLTFANGLTAPVLRVHRAEELGVSLRELGFHSPRPTLVLVGGAGGLNDADLTRLRPLFVQALAPLANALGASVVDGGTDAGVIRLMGQARAETGATFPLVGVAAVETVALPDASPPRADAAPLEPHHTHFLLVPGDQWGDESSWLARVAGVLADGAPSITVLVNGGEIAWEDVSQSVKAGRPVVVIAGSGRVADTLAAALRREAVGERARELATSELVQAVELTEGPDVLAKMIRKMLSAKQGTTPAQTSYREGLKQDLSTLIEALDLPDLQKHFLRSRWLDQVVWMEGRADSAHDRYYALRLTTVIGGVIVPALVSLNVSGQVASAIHWLTLGLSLLVAISAAVEEFFHYGERWRHYRRTVEWLKIEGWQFFQLSGPYRRYKSHAEAYAAFANRVEGIIQRDVEVYITEVVREKEEEKQGTP